jgi:hypothetical protein
MRAGETSSGDRVSKRDPPTAGPVSEHVLLKFRAALFPYRASAYVPVSNSVTKPACEGMRLEGILLAQSRVRLWWRSPVANGTRLDHEQLLTLDAPLSQACGRRGATAATPTMRGLDHNTVRPVPHLPSTPAIGSGARYASRGAKGAPVRHAMVAGPGDACAP